MVYSYLRVNITARCCALKLFAICLDYEVFDVTACLVWRHTTRQPHNPKLGVSAATALYRSSMRNVIVWAYYRATLSTLYLPGNN